MPVTCMSKVMPLHSDWRRRNHRKKKIQKKNKDSVKASKDSAEEIAANAAVGKSAVQIVQEEIDSVANSLDVPKSLIKKRILHSRPTNWESIAENADVSGNYSTIRTFQEVFSKATSGTA